MKIDSIKQQYSMPNFRAGKVRVFSDFDKTFSPATHNDFARQMDKCFVDAIRENFKSFKDFLANTKDGLKFTITTGRTFGEFQKMAEIARERKFGMPLPDTLIVKNGSDEHIRTGSDEAFYNGGEFPFKYDVTNKEKEENIKKLTGWDGKKIRDMLIKLFESYNLRIVEADSEHSVGDYDSRSLFSQGKLPYEVGKEFIALEKADWSVGLRRDGNLKIYALKPYDEYDVEERKLAFKDISQKLESQMNKEGIKWTHRDDDDGVVHGRKPMGYCPRIKDGYSGRHGLNKAYDVNEAVKEAIKNNDLVIAAGDSSNDKAMLQPTRFFVENLPKELKAKYSGPANAKHLDSEEDDAIIFINKHPDLAEAYRKMPFIGVIVRHHGGKNELQGDLLDECAKGENKKIIIVNEGELQKGIKEAVKLYCKQNPEYAKKLNLDLKKEIEMTDDKPDGGGGCPPRK